MKKTLLTISLALAATFSANAVLILDATNDIVISSATRGGNNGNPSAASFASWVGATGPLTELYKENQDGSEAGAFADSYDTVFANSFSDADITWDGLPDPFISGFAEIWLLLKDGRHNWFAWNISGWDGKMAIDVNSAYSTEQGDISHLSIFAGGTKVKVPDSGSTALLLGAAFLALVGFRQRRN